MRTLLTLGLALGLLAAPLAAAEPTETQILFQPKNLLPAHGGPGIKWANFGAAGGVLMGGEGSVVLSPSVGLGVGGWSLASELLVPGSAVDRDLGLSYGGAVMHYNFFSRRLYYFDLSMLGGAGQAWSVFRKIGAQRQYAGFGVLEPELACTLNVTREFRASLGVGQRLFLGDDLAGRLGSDLNGYTLTLLLWYGKI